ncbi:unnamed protein product [Dovyalis caffra]|uniref:Leucine-rich repeat-containing N-terminal plant-type domain-containing protein n=1 Tax=Dovyalis caffra TaxID=77055 RepID=A0AAV1S6B4_9ROSI|nr:unnamed protein product [Dovyalis caffra]
MDREKRQFLATQSEALASGIGVDRLWTHASALVWKEMSYVVVSCTGLVAALDSALLASEGKALLESGWWNGYDNFTSRRCRWPGIFCNHAGSVIEISPPSEFLKVRNKFGEMNFSCFSNLVRLELANHELNGTIPSQIYSLPKLRYLNLSSNNLTGELPTSLGNLSRLVELDFSFNHFFTSIPPELGNLKNLEILDVSYNKLNGPISQTLGSLAKLRSLNLHRNQINGPIPSEIGSLTNLENLDLGSNKLVGSIRPMLGRLSNLRITGPIPSEIGNLKNLDSLYLNSNYITGSIPFALDLCSNRISGSIPTTLGSLSYLKDIDLSRNQIDGSIPVEIGNLANLVSLDLSLNKISGNGQLKAAILVTSLKAGDDRNMDPCISFGLERQYETTQERPDELDLELAYENAMHSIYYKSSVIIEGKH